ncbi:MAG TPA: response regulator transcription factor [Mycobacteriales bacterium]|jgi:DNA-binding NarL/FixJ family response regulator|nr:response regulator transcription factor [Mycobacteriales bacterium]
MGTTTTVALVDDHQTLLDLLGFAIDAESDLVVVGTATTAADGLALVARTCPDVVLLDFVLPDGDGVTVATALAHDHPETRVVMLTASEDAELITLAARAGAAGFVMKSGALSQLLDTIRAARIGTMIVDPVFLARLGSSRRRPAADDGPPPPVLTRRELDVLERLGQGKDPRTIARELCISVHTCRGYVKSTLAKLNCHSQLEAVVTARRLGLLSGPKPVPAAG